MEETGKSQA